MKLFARFMRWVRRNHVSTELFNDYAYEATKAGWVDGPVWRTPAEIERMNGASDE